MIYVIPMNFQTGKLTVLLDISGPFNFKKLFDFTSFFQDPVRNAAKCCEMLRKFRRFVLKHNIY